MERYELVRRSVLVDGMSLREASREFAVNRRTAKKMAQSPLPPGYRMEKPRAKPKPGGFLPVIEEILADKLKEYPGKQRLTALKVYERLRDDHGYTGGYCQVRRTIKALRERSREAFIPLEDLPGEAQADFGESVVEIAGQRMTGHGFFCLLPQSDVWFKQVYPRENLESFLDGHEKAFKFFGMVPKRMLYDNAGYAVKPQGKPLVGRDRELTQGFSELKCAFLFEAEFAAPRKGNEKGSVERRVGTLRSRLMTPVPKADSWEDLNEHLLAEALKNKEAKAEAFAKDAAAMLPLVDYEPCRLVSAKPDKLGLVQFENCFYSVPAYGPTTVLVKATPFEIRILSSNQTIAVHKRIFEKGRISTDLSHYIDVLEHKPRAVRTATPVLQAGLPDVFELYRRKVYDNTGVGDRKFVAILRLSLDLGKEQLAAALKTALASGALDPSDVRLLVLKQTEAPPVSLCMAWKSPTNQEPPKVERPPLSDYTMLLAVCS